jgi:hypothetical protein
MVVRIASRRMYLWRAVDQEGEILDLLIQPRRTKANSLSALLQKGYVHLERVLPCVRHIEQLRLDQAFVDGTIHRHRA